MCCLLSTELPVLSISDVESILFSASWQKPFIWWFIIVNSHHLYLSTSTALENSTSKIFQRNPADKIAMVKLLCWTRYYGSDNLKVNWLYTEENSKACFDRQTKSGWKTLQIQVKLTDRNLDKNTNIYSIIGSKKFPYYSQIWYQILISMKREVNIHAPERLMNKKYLFIDPTFVKCCILG